MLATGSARVAATGSRHGLTHASSSRGTVTSQLGQYSPGPMGLPHTVWMNRIGPACTPLMVVWLCPQSASRCRIGNTSAPAW